ncbi:MAG: 3-oxoacyl-[acyl-carrier-protein] reductase [Acidobacteria bacterium]|nr:3-oxoacyl-[acyl-carrier-protein] reductase [Acidobacteriota bacterium]
MSTSSDLKGKRAIVTGAGSGIGRAIALRLAREGVEIAVGDVVGERAEAVSAELAQLGVRSKAYTFSVGEPVAAQDAVARVAADFGGVDILVNNAGITRDTLLMRMNDQDWDSVLTVNLKGTFNMTRACVRLMIKERWGRIVNIASVIGQMGNAGQANYAAAKGGIIAFTKSVAKEVGSRNVTCNAIAPGFITTPMTDALPEDVRAAYIKLIPLGRFGTPEDVAEVCAFLASGPAAYITGQVIRVDGGMLTA